MKKNLKIVHCANFSQLKEGKVFYAMDQKITHGLIQSNHFVYDFSYRDMAKAQRFLWFKKRSIDLINQNLINICMNIKPDVLLLSKAENISYKTLEAIKKLFPEIKIAQWYVDFLANENKSFFHRFNYIDAFFQTTANGLYELSQKYKTTSFSYMPNISDILFEKDLSLEKEYDVIYIASDYKEDVRTKFAHLLNDFCEKENINLKMYGSLGNPPIYGHRYYEEISKSKIAINFNREDKLDGYNKNKILGSSDRMNQFLGSRVCTFSPKIISMDKLYESNKDVVYFNDTKDCFSKIKYYLKDNRYADIALSGQNKSYALSNAKRVTNFILELTYGKQLSENYEWKDYIFKVEDNL